MNTLGNLNDRREGFERPQPAHRPPSALILSIAALSFVAIIAVAYFGFFSSPAEKTARQEQQREAPMALSTEAQIFEDEAIIKDTTAVIGGTVRNISQESLNDLSLEVELKRRSDGSAEIRTLKIEPQNLAPGEEGKFSLTIPRQQFSGSQIRHLRSSARQAFIVFKTSPGARRPRELPPEPPTRTVTVERPSPRSNSEEFINTPETPTKVH